MFDSPWLALYGPWLIGGTAGLVAFLITAAVVRVVVRRRDRIRLDRRGSLPATNRPIGPMPLEPTRPPAPFKQAPHIGWLLVLLATALIGAVVVVLGTPQAKRDGISSSAAPSHAR